MHMHGIVMSATLEEGPAGGEVIDMVLRVQGVGAGQPRRIVIPYALLLKDEGLDPDAIRGHAFQAEVEEAEGKRWIVSEITFAGSRVLRDEGGL